MGKHNLDFLKTLKQCGISNGIINNIGKKDDSPLKRAREADLPQPNNINHSFKVWSHSLKAVYKAGLKITPNDYLLLFYSSLLHDISKSMNTELAKDIESVLNEKCKLFSQEKSDHGIRSAHYVQQKPDKIIKLYGIKEGNIRQLLNIISFHTSGMMHACFLPEDKPLPNKEIFLCLVFWLADIADGACDRIPSLRLVNEASQSSKGKARLGIEKVEIKKNVVVWRFHKKTKELTKAAFMSNVELSKHRLLLQAFGLPSRVICLPENKRIQAEEPYLDHSDIISANLCLSVSKRGLPLVLSADTLPELYEKVVEAFYTIKVKDSLLHSNYFGPVILEVKNIEYDEAEKTNIRSETGKHFRYLKKYRDLWLKYGQEADKPFYFGYTHGQRIWKYLYPDDERGLSATLKDPNKFKEWKGEIDQLKHVLKILEKGGLEARRAYVVIPNLLMDNPESRFFNKEEMAPSLLAIHFMLEEHDKGGYKLSAFVLSRAQELSTFFVVNYLEAKKLIEKLTVKLRGKFKSKNIKPGRIIMLTAIAYFEPNTVLLDKPEICQKKETEYQNYAGHIDDSSIRAEFIELLNKFKKDYTKIDAAWCKSFKKYLLKTEPCKRISKGIKKLEDKLTLLEEKRIEGYPVTHSKIKPKKEKAIDEFIKIIKGVFNEV